MQYSYIFRQPCTTSSKVELQVHGFDQSIGSRDLNSVEPTFGPCGTEVTGRRTCELLKSLRTGRGIVDIASTMTDRRAHVRIFTPLREPGTTGREIRMLPAILLEAGPTAVPLRLTRARSRRAGVNESVQTFTVQLGRNVAFGGSV
jgi:hypothetical protein